MSANVAHDFKAREEARAVALRARIVLAFGPVTALGGVAWAVLQPWRLTLLHPYGQGIWWLLAEPQLYVVAVGVLFRLLLAPGIAADVEAARR
jgi:hypothetical protein